MDDLATNLNIKIIWDKGGFMAKIKLIMVILFVWHSVAIVYGSDVKFDGNFWRQSDRTTKELFISGVLGGIQLGQDRARGSMMQDITNTDFSPKCYDSVSKKIDSLDSNLRKIGTAQVIAKIDQFYLDLKIDLLM